jgi:hypothetical protein
MGRIRSSHRSSVRVHLRQWASESYKMLPGSELRRGIHGVRSDRYRKAESTEIGGLFGSNVCVCVVIVIVGAHVAVSCVGSRALIVYEAKADRRTP